MLKRKMIRGRPGLRSRLTALLCVLSFACAGQAQTTDANSQPPQEPKPFLDLYGFAMLDAGYDFKQVDPNWFDVLRTTKLPSYSHQFGANGNSYWSVRQTRFGAKSEVPTGLGTLKTIFEFELLGTGANAGQTTFRLRHAYGELGHFGGGQYWSAFVDPDAFPNTVEYWGPPGLIWFRNVQFRWTPIMGDSHLVFAVERPGASVDGGIYADRLELQGIKPHFPAPDFTGNGRLGRKWGHIQAGWALRRIEWSNAGSGQPNISNGVWGWGVNLSSSLKTHENGTIRAQVLYGRGIENYMNDAPIDVATATNPANSATPIAGRALPALGFSAYYDIYWSKKLSSTFGYSRIKIDNTSGQNPSDFRVGQYASTNLLYYPVKNVMAGAEFIYGYRRNYTDHFHVPDYRIQFSFKYNFSFRIGG